MSTGQAKKKCGGSVWKRIWQTLAIKRLRQWTMISEVHPTVKPHRKLSKNNHTKNNDSDYYTGVHGAIDFTHSSQAK